MVLKTQVSFNLIYSIVSKINVENETLDDSVTVKNFFDELFDTKSTSQVSSHLNDAKSVIESLPIKDLAGSSGEYFMDERQRLSFGGVYSTNCMLPRYLADNMKRCNFYKLYLFIFEFKVLVYCFVY